MERPTVSVVIPCYNSGLYIIEAVESAIKQQGGFILTEVIVIDDHSDDRATLDALEALKENQIVKVVPNKYSKGPGGARNTGIDAVQSEWTAFLDADDILLPTSIAARVDALSRYPHVKWCGGDFIKLYPDGSYSEPVYKGGDKDSPAFDNYDFNGSLLVKNPLTYFFVRMLTWLGAVLINTGVLRKIGGFKEALLYGEDSNLFVRIALDHDFLYIPDVTFIHRQHGKSLTKRKTPTKEWQIKSYKSLLGDEGFRPHYKYIRRMLKELYEANYKFYHGQGRRIRSQIDRVGYLFYKNFG